MLDYIDDEYREVYLNLPTPIGPPIYDDPSSSHVPVPVEPLFHEDSSHSAPVAPVGPTPVELDDPVGEISEGIGVML
jgi:hypothetical protein